MINRKKSLASKRQWKNMTPEERKLKMRKAHAGVKRRWSMMSKEDRSAYFKKLLSIRWQNK